MDDRVIAQYWESKESKVIRCVLCPNHCNIHEGKTGKCGVRVNINGELFADGYGKVTSIALDPIEKKPLYHFHSGKKIVSIGGYGCNFHCPFCQNYIISQEYQNIKTDHLSPEIIADVARQALPDGNIGVAYTYNEPLIGYEFVKDCAELIKQAGLVNVLVTNGYINKEPLNELLPLIDAMNVDIKGYHSGTYNEVGGTLEAVLRTVEMSSKICHVEVTTLILPNENEEDVEEIARWLSEIDSNTPYHLSRSFPRYKSKSNQATPPETMYKLRDIARKYLSNVYIGNM